MHLCLTCRAAEPPTPPQITYHLSCYNSTEMAKPKSKREPCTTFLCLCSDLPFDTLKAQLLVKISGIFEPTILSYDNYVVTFSVPRHSKDPLPLITDEDYKFMITRATKAKDAVANIKIVCNNPNGEKVCYAAPVLDCLW